VGAIDELLAPRDDLIGRDVGMAQTDVVDAFKQDHILHARQTENVSIESNQRRVAKQGIQDPDCRDGSGL